jgi:hypothetical protein
MDPKTKLEQSKQRPFWQQYILIMGIDTIIVFLGSLLLGDLRQMTNLYFWSTLILLIIAAVPILTEVGTSVKIRGKAIKDGEEVGSQLKDKQSSFDRGARITYLFGLAGLTTFLLAFVTLIIG